jgi:hypothetical protein|tara:strand:+ start:976 stop:1110 length:135 start_codon:yes stop_codon:yes gene_type:complete
MKAKSENLALNLSEFEIAIAGLNISVIVTLIIDYLQNAFYKHIT